MSDIISGYSGLYQSPVSSTDTMKSSIYCIGNKDHNTLIMVPLTSEFYYTAISLVKSLNYDHIYMIIPTLDIRMISSVYNIWSHLINSNKDIFIFTLEDYQFNLQKDTTFYNSITWLHSGEDCHLMEFGSDMSYIFSIHSFCGSNLQICGDIILSDNTKKVLLSQYITQDKLNYYIEPEHLSLYDEIHVPYIDTPYGGLTYLETRKIIHQSIISKLYTYGFHTSNQMIDCIELYHGRVGKDVYFDIV